MIEEIIRSVAYNKLVRYFARIKINGQVWTYTFNLMPKSCKNVQYDLHKYVSFFRSIASLLDGEFSSISFLDIYQ